MPILPLMPSSSDQIGTSMPGPMETPPPTPGMGGGDMASMFMNSDPSQSMGGAFDPISGALMQFDQVGQAIADLARMFPDSGDAAMATMEALNMWRQQVLVTMTPPPSAMPGAETML